MCHYHRSIRDMQLVTLIENNIYIEICIVFSSIYMKFADIQSWSSGNETINEENTPQKRNMEQNELYSSKPKL